MDIDQHVNQIVQNIVAQITTQVQQQAMAAIEQKITEVVAAIDCMPIIAEKINQKIDIRLSQLPIDATTIEAELKTRVGKLANNLAAEVQTRSMQVIKTEVTDIISKIDFQSVYKSTVLSAVQQGEMSFPPASIPMSSIDLQGLVVTGDNIKGGIIENFGSTGIDDKATTCQLSIFDTVTVVENNLLTKDLTVKGTATIEGDLNVTGTVPESSPLFQNIVRAATNNVRTSLDSVVFQSYADMVTKRIKDEGLDLNKITVNGREAIDGSNLGNHITFSNLQRVGTLQELQVSGETLLGQTVYVSNKRTGINTLEPAQALSIWDQEIEIGFGKLENNVGIIGSPRNQSMVLGVNGKRNITMNPDGSILTTKIGLGTVTLYSSGTPPSTDEPKGTVVFNANPTLGGPLGWISLGGAQWANFGFID